MKQVKGFGTGIQETDPDQRNTGKWQNSVSRKWSGVFTRLWVVMLLFFITGALMSQVNNPCALSNMDLDSLSLALLCSVLFILAMTIISFMKPSNKLIGKMFMIGTIGYFSAKEATGYYMLEFVIKARPLSEQESNIASVLSSGEVCRSVIEWGLSPATSTFIILITGLVAVSCLRGNQGEYNRIMHK